MHHSRTLRNTSQRKLQPVPKHPRTDAVVQQGQADGMAIRREQLPRTSRNETAEVESISSDMASQRRQPVQMAQFLQKEIDTQYMNIIVTALTTRYRCGRFSSAADGVSSSSQPQEFQTTFDDDAIS